MHKSLRKGVLAGLYLLVLVGTYVISMGSSSCDGPRCVRVVFLGDSFTAGYGLWPWQQSFPAIIQDRAKTEGIHLEVINAGLSGDWSSGALQRLPPLLSEPTTILFVAIGLNDGMNAADPSTIRNNLKVIIKTARASAPNIKIVIAEMQLLSSMVEASYNQEYAQKFADLYSSVATEEKVIFFPFLWDTFSKDPTLFQSDGIHPTAAGQKIIANVTWEFLKPILKK